MANRLIKKNDQNENRLLNKLFLKLSKENNPQPRILYSAKLILKNEGKRNPFSGKD